MDRRDLIRLGITAGAGLTLASLLIRANLMPRKPPLATTGNLVGDDSLRLPSGFKHHVISEIGTRMDDGHKVPELHDGMGCFSAKDGGYILVRNHEISAFDRSFAPESAYNPRCRGSTTTVHLDKNLNLIRHYLSLTGTVRNCGGGVMPWGSWLSCEEKFVTWGGIRHGYVFEVDHRQANDRPAPLIGLGRFSHEACAWEPRFGHIYMTEDKSDGNLYRFVPKKPGTLTSGGSLQALAITAQLNESQLLCEWIDITDPDPDKDTLRYEAQSKGGAQFLRPEGIWIDDDGIYFSTTAGGKNGTGEIFRYIVKDRDSGMLELVYESDGTQLIHPDALTKTPGGDLLVCADSSTSQQRIFGLTPDNQAYVFAEAAQCGWAGITFSPDQRVLFVNQQYYGRTLAITGDWSSLGT